MLLLPTEIKTVIFEKLDLESIFNCCLVSNDFHETIYKTFRNGVLLEFQGHRKKLSELRAQLIRVDKLIEGSMSSNPITQILTHVINVYYGEEQKQCVFEIACACCHPFLLAIPALFFSQEFTYLTCLGLGDFILSAFDIKVLDYSNSSIQKRINEEKEIIFELMKAFSDVEKNKLYLKLL